MSKVLTVFGQTICRFIEGLVHPSAMADPLRAPRHAAFITASLIAGSAALILLPLHLALAGPASLPLTLALAWGLAQWPLALFLSRTGYLGLAQAASAALFALFIGAICALTGGVASFALLWLLLPPLEAALSGDRRAVLWVTTLCVLEAALLASMAPISGASPLSVMAVSPEAALAISTAGGLAYAALLALRFAWDQRRGDTLLADREHDLRLVCDTLGDLVLRLGEGGDVTSLTGPSETVVGVPARALQRQGLFQRLHVADRPAYLKTVSDAQRGLDPARLDIRLRTGTAQPGQAGVADYRWLDLSCRRLPDGQVVAVLRDASQRKLEDERIALARSAAEAESAAKSRMLATVSHELRTPLNAIIGFSDLLRASPAMLADERRKREYVELIHESGTHLLEVVEGLLDVSRIETGHYDLTIAPFDLTACLESCRHMLAAEAAQRRVTIRTEICSGLSAFPADRRACRQIVLNLLSNAIKFSVDGGEVVLAARLTGEAVELSVRDAGVGMDADTLARIGEPYFRAAPSGTTGTGLGLSVVKALTELHGGSLRIDSRKGMGTEVSVTLPLAASRPTEPERAASGLKTVA
ncbi:PAS domain-containing sensor histidine kinase [Microvirga tunisiensis]|uniref:histidine kinase n=1 Tax=Pannonibacter tanglangensis TaxID=2750084 RepID=A0A7X5J947_9HYPH|nr:PAS domain-containing sensor histidine kinase [Pannonibacter sp. XCT-53]